MIVCCKRPIRLVNESERCKERMSDNKQHLFLISINVYLIRYQEALFTIAAMLVFKLSCKIGMCYAGGQTSEKRQIAEPLCGLHILVHRNMPSRDHFGKGA